MNFTKNEYSAPSTIEINNTLGAVLELPAKQHCQFGPFLSFMGWIGSAV
jgi:hypothetical protein